VGKKVFNALSTYLCITSVVKIVQKLNFTRLFISHITM